MTALVVIRETLAKLAFNSPFVLAFIFLPQPFNILGVCLLILKLNAFSTTDQHEMMILLHFLANLLSKQEHASEEEIHSRKKIKKVFMKEKFEIDDADVELGPQKVVVETIFDALETLLVLVLIVLSFIQVL